MRGKDREMHAVRRRILGCALAGAVALLGLGGCGGAAGPALADAGAAAPAGTADSLVGRFVSWMSGGDCPGAAAGGCCPREEETASPSAPVPPPVVVVEARLYCYRTLAEITCYETPDPQASASRLVR